MTKKELQIIMEQYYKFIGITSKKKQKDILNILTYCKEIRDTSYPMKNSNVTELQIVEFTAHKEKDMISINGSLSLVDGDKSENRCFEAYIMGNNEETRVYMDITRLCVEDEPKIIRTSETLVDNGEEVFIVTKYNQTEFSSEKVFSVTIPSAKEQEAVYRMAELKQLHI
ncbi:MAG: hypothetical protein ACI4WW_02405 [Candidatus Coprovivens sp.]